MLFLVPTPIGNLKDITFRALDILRSADLIVCEDTRQTQKLLRHYGIVGAIHELPLLSLHEHSGPGRVREIISLLEQEKSVALVSDGGMPLVSDPGFELVHEAIQKSIRVEALPGPTAFATALAASGLATDSFSFFGFPPIKSQARKKMLEKLLDREETLIFYESPYRLLKLLEEMKEVLGDREAAVARELTKKFEEISRGFLSELIRKFSGQSVKGEIVVLVSGKNRKQVLH